MARTTIDRLIINSPYEGEELWIEEAQRRHRLEASIQRFSPADFIRRGLAPGHTRTFVLRRIKLYSFGSDKLR
ncbi:MAG: hypothetical protein L0Z68_01600 [Gammaproteobacteria bacterium]|nr:hypothetical protein [Gammaproteobacteria bacterium]